MRTIFSKKGVVIKASANFRINLQKKGAVWLLEKGSLILFAVEKKEKAIEGRRIMLTTISEGHLFFSVSWNEDLPYEIFALSEEPIIVWEMKAGELSHSICDSPYAKLS